LSKKIKLGVVMDPIGSISVKKDSTLAMLVEAQSRGWEIHYMEMADLYLEMGQSRSRTRKLSVSYDPDGWFEFGSEQDIALSELSVILMRKDPPFDIEYIYATYLLELAEAAGVLVVNRPQSLRDANEKLFTAWFPQCMPACLVTRDQSRLRSFLEQHNDIVVKPLGGMGGESVFRVQMNNPNIGVIIETLTKHGTLYAMAQKFIPEIVEGDKRILVINGDPVPYALARIPQAGETRGNLAAGGTGVGVELSDQDRWICQQVAPTLKEKGLVFVGLDVIGDYLTEINVTSPTCIRELDSQYNINISATLMDVIEKRVQ
jgi:glutathione synthase